MTDDLVKRLWDGKLTWVDIWGAADRIEALERERDELQKDFDGLDAASRTLINEARSIAEAAEARLAKAVEALRFYAEGKWPEDYPGGVLHDVDGVTHIDYGHKATAVLAEIEGGKKDD